MSRTAEQLRQKLYARNEKRDAVLLVFLLSLFVLFAFFIFATMNLIF